MMPPTDQALRPRTSPRDVALAPLPVRHAPPVGADAGEFKTYVAVLVSSRWLIVAAALVVGLLGFLYALSVQSVYEADMTFQVDETGSNASRNVLTGASSLYESKSVTVAEMELLRSRMVLAPVVDALRLHINVQPVYFPVVGAAFVRVRGDTLAQPVPFGLDSYAWGGERLVLATFDVSGAPQRHAFVVTATGNGTYRLSDNTAGVHWNGKVGTPLRGRIDGADVVVEVAALRARPGARFRVGTVSKQAAVARIRAALAITEQGRQSGVVAVRLEGEDPALVHAILAETAQQYLRQAVARKREDAERSLAFINAQLTPLRTQLTRAEAAYAQFQHRHGTVDLADETRVGVEQAADARARQAILLQRKVELTSKFTSQHPVMVGIDNQLREMDRAARADARAINDLAALEQDEQSLARDIKGKSELYSTLTTMAQQLRILVTNQSSNVRLIDAPALPESPVRPNRPLIVAAAVMAGLLLGMLASFVKRAVSSGIDGPEALENLLGTKVMHVSIPHSAVQRQLCKKAGRSAGRLPLLARVAPEDHAVEALRAFRAVLHHALQRCRNNIVMLTGPSAGLGKTFLSANAATVIAAGGKRVLLIDADLRDGQLARYFSPDPGGAPGPGLQDVLAGLVPVSEAIRHGVMRNLDFMSAGSAPADASELLTNTNCAALLACVSDKYDLVLIDAPRVLGAAGALIFGAHAGAVFLTVRAGVSTADDITGTIMRLNQAGIVPEGVLFNDLKRPRGLPQRLYKPGAVRQLARAGTL